VIALDDDGVAAPLAGETDDESILDAAGSCPMGAITVFEQLTGARAA
jgi:ferredoxin